jgi:hypothetical protein
MARGRLAYQRGKIHHHTRLVPLPITIPQWHFSHLHVDLVGPLQYSNNPVYLLGDPSSFARGANTHPLLSLAGYQLFSPCCLAHPKGTPQIKSHIYIDDINNISCPI